METVGDLRRRACGASKPLWEAFGIRDDMTIAELREEWTAEAAVQLARVDGRGPRVGAVAWLDRELGTAVLAGADLCYVDLSHAYLVDVDMREAQLRGADMRGSDLRDALLVGADLREADMSGSLLVGADLRGGGHAGVGSPRRDARMENADLSMADTTGSIR